MTAARAGPLPRCRVSQTRLLPLALLLACGTTRPLRPLAPGEVLLSASVGGPLVEVSELVLPTPMLMMGAAYGWRPRFTATMDVGITAALYGNLHLAPG